MFSDPLQIEGTVASARAGLQPVGEAGEPMVVLSLQLVDVGPVPRRHTAQVDQVWPPQMLNRAKQRAQQLQGVRVQVQADPLGVHLHIPNAAHIRQCRDTDPTPSPAPATQPPQEAPCP